MRRSAWPLLVISSLLALASAGEATSRPHYGGTVHVMVRETPGSLEPAMLAATQDDHILALIYEGLTCFDDRSRLQPQLATRWQADPDGRHWKFWLRNGLKFHDGTSFSADTVAASLRAVNPEWKVTAAGDSVEIETGTPDPMLPAELALPRNAILDRGGNKAAGTGPFYVAEWRPGKRLLLTAFEDYREGRPFADALEITLGQNLRQQMIALELGRADVVEVAAQQVRRATLDGKRIFESAPDELIALVFARDPQSQDEARLRQALSAAIDRGSIGNVLLHGQGEAAYSILPNWMTGYAFLFAPGEAAKPSAAQQFAPAAMTLSYDATEPLNQLIAQRVALSAVDLGVNLQPVASPASADVRLLLIPLQSADPQVALAAVATAAGLVAAPLQETSPDEIYAREQRILQSGRIIPLLHVPQAAAVENNLRGWREDQFGAWPLADVWLEAARP
jgi:peptide/nickel transport system substrate-binding protein